MSGHTSIASTQPFTDSAEVRRRVVEGNSSSSQPSYNESTQPFTDSAEVRRRAGVAAPEPQDREELAPQPLQAAPEPRQHTREAKPPGPPSPHPHLPSAPTPLNFPIEELAEAFANASLATLPDARLVIACPTGSSPGGPDSLIIPLPRGIGGWDTVGVVQRTSDVDFVIDLPFWVQSKVKPFEWKCEQLKCRLYYDPASDDCLLVNESWGHIYLTRLAPAGVDQPCLARSDRYVVSPGVWRISIFEGREFRQHLLDFCLLRRQFVVGISEAPATDPSPTKHPVSGNDEVIIKRRRLQGDVSEILLAPATVRVQHLSDASAIVTPNTIPSPSLGTITPTPTRQISQTDIPLLDLRDGEVAIVRTTQPKDTETKPRTQATHVTTLESYKLRRVGGIANTTTSSVFVGQHSELPEPIVAKVIRYGGMSSNDLVKCARRWQIERDILDRLRHRSIVSLQAFDGRLFAVYLERLPSSLHRGTNSPFQLSDALIILRDISSALSYLDMQHIAHNDIKPANITYSPQRGAVLIDFEMATSTTGDPSSGGTPWYLPPEFVKSPKNRGALGDIWALGVTLLYVLGKIGLPEKTVEPWRIYDVADKQKEASGKMKAWLQFVAVKRQGLDCKDRVQGLVYRMLEGEPESRVRAKQVSATFEDDSG
ncbi:kinase-like domain-containing protein [Thermothelomyces heterothallicus CBS 202.75]|uniref:kinase-like domain-containing protein n=1 Tax=Thermothelomyces heterothallicus CBS 202.75 TaxID=1149848 RepID=UPI00374392B5